MTVSEFISFLQTQPQDIPVAYRIHSEQCLVETKDIQIEDLCVARPDGWVADLRPDVASQKYLVLPGN